MSVFAVSAVVINGVRTCVQTAVKQGVGRRLNEKAAPTRYSAPVAAAAAKPTRTKLTLVKGVLTEVPVPDDDDDDSDDSDSDDAATKRRQAQAPASAQAANDDDAPTFVAFSGSGQSLRAAKKR
jgi:hypothetical protein